MGDCHPAKSQQAAEGPQASDEAQDCPQLVRLEEEEEAAEADSEGDAEPQAKRPAISAVTRGSMLDAALFPEQDLRLNIGICGATRDGEEVLEVSSSCLGISLWHSFPLLQNSVISERCFSGRSRAGCVLTLQCQVNMITTHSSLQSYLG